MYSIHTNPTEVPSSKAMMISMIPLVVVGFAAATSTSPTCAADVKAASVTLEDIELPQSHKPGDARRIFQKYGVLVVRGLNRAHANVISGAAEAAFNRSLALLESGRLERVDNEQHFLGWITPDQTLFIPAPKGHVRDKQAMVLAVDYYSDAAMLAAAIEPRTLDLIEEISGWNQIELFSKGQCFYKEGVATATSAGGINATMMGEHASADEQVSEGVKPGGNPKYMHQDSAYFMFAHDGAIATLSYAVDTSEALDNGPLYVVPGSYRLGHVPHVDTPSHLGVPAEEWSFSDGLRIDGRAGDTVFFHIHTLHGSTPNRSPNPRTVFINRYIEASDYQTYFATDARMRERAQSEYEARVREGRLPAKERGFMVRGQRPWREDGPKWRLNPQVNH